MAYEVGQRVGDYEIVQLLGVGGMGSVYRVRNVISDRTEAMKVLLPDLTAERDLAIRFIAEIRTLAGFDHPNIALLHTAFQSDNQLIMMMEFVEGSTLEQRAKQGPMAITEVCGYVYQALSALSYAHGRGVVHRDIKPANLMLTSHGIMKLMDFGIAKSAVETNLTRPGTTIGSLYYMSPEQVKGDPVDARSDLYSMGIVLYELLAGRRPFEAETTFSILNQQLNALPQPPIELNSQLPQGLNDLIVKALAKRPEERFQSADEFREVLRPFCQSQGGAPGYAAAAASSAAAPVPTRPEWAARDLTQPGSIPPYEEVRAIGAPQAPVSSGSYPPPPAWPGAAPPPGYKSTSPMAPGRPAKGNKALWIGTGVAAALLAMAGLTIGLPHLIHAAPKNDGSGGQVTGSQAPGPAPEVVPVVEPPPVGTGKPLPVVPGKGVGPGFSTAPAKMPPPEVSSLSAGPKRPPYGGAGAAADRPAVGQAAEPASTGVHGSSTSTSTSAAEMEQLQDRFTDVSARAGAVNSSVGRLRHEQEAEGLGLRGDMESADNRMESYLRAADQDLRAGNAAAATKDLNRAEGELAVLEKFLGR